MEKKKKSQYHAMNEVYTHNDIITYDPLDNNGAVNRLETFFCLFHFKICSEKGTLLPWSSTTTRVALLRKCRISLLLCLCALREVFGPKTRRSLSKNSTPILHNTHASKSLMRLTNLDNDPPMWDASPY